MSGLLEVANRLSTSSPGGRGNDFLNCAKDDPRDCPRISRAERNSVEHGCETERGNRRDKVRFPRGRSLMLPRATVSEILDRRGARPGEALGV